MALRQTDYSQAETSSTSRDGSIARSPPDPQCRAAENAFPYIAHTLSEKKERKKGMGGWGGVGGEKHSKTSCDRAAIT